MAELSIAIAGAKEFRPDFYLKDSVGIGRNSANVVLAYALPDPTADAGFLIATPRSSKLIQPVLEGNENIKPFLTRHDGFEPFVIYEIGGRDRFKEAVEAITTIKEIVVGGIDAGTAQYIIEKGQLHFRGVDGILYMGVPAFSASLARYIGILNNITYKRSISFGGFYSQHRYFSDKDLKEPQKDETENTKKILASQGVAQTEYKLTSVDEAGKSEGVVEPNQIAENADVVAENEVVKASAILPEHAETIEALYGSSGALAAVNTIKKAYTKLVLSEGDSVGRFLAAYLLHLKDETQDETLQSYISEALKVALDGEGVYKAKPVNARAIRKVISDTILPYISEKGLTELDIYNFASRLVSSEIEEAISIVKSQLFEPKGYEQVKHLDAALAGIYEAQTVISQKQKLTNLANACGALYRHLQKALVVIPTEGVKGKSIRTAMRKAGLTGTEEVICRSDIPAFYVKNKNAVLFSPLFAKKQQTPVQQAAMWLVILGQLDKLALEAGYDGGIDMSVFGFYREDGGKVPAFSKTLRADVRKVIGDIDPFSENAYERIYELLKQSQAVEYFEKFYNLYGLMRDKAQLLPHQVRAYEKLVQAYEGKKQGFIVAHATGTGKSFVISAFTTYIIASHQAKKRVLIIAPNAILYKLSDELSNYAAKEGIHIPPMKIVVNSKEMAKVQVGEKPVILGTTYNMIAGADEEGKLGAYQILEHYDVLIADEAHFAKNIKVIRKETIQQLGISAEKYGLKSTLYGVPLPSGFLGMEEGTSKRAAALFLGRYLNPNCFFVLFTATPAPNSPHDMWNAAHVVGVPDNINDLDPFALASRFGASTNNMTIIYPKNFTGEMTEMSKAYFAAIEQGGWMDTYKTDEAQKDGILKKAARIVDIQQPDATTARLLEAITISKNAADISTAIHHKFKGVVRMLDEVNTELSNEDKLTAWNRAREDFKASALYAQMKNTFTQATDLDAFIDSNILYPNGPELSFEPEQIRKVFSKLSYYHLGLTVYQSNLLAGYKMIKGVEYVVNKAAEAWKLKIEGKGRGKIFITSQYRIPLIVYGYSILRFYTYAYDAFMKGDREGIEAAAERAKAEGVEMAKAGLAIMQGDDQRKLLLLPNVMHLYEEVLQYIVASLGHAAAEKQLSLAGYYHLMYAVHVGRAMMKIQKSYTERDEEGQKRFDEASLKLMAHARKWFEKEGATLPRMPVEIIFTGSDKINEKYISAIVGKETFADIVSFGLEAGIIPKKVFEAYQAFFESTGQKTFASTAEKRYEISRAFMNMDSGLWAIVAGLKTVGVGLNFHVADYMLIMDYPLSFGDVLQGEGRVVRFEETPTEYQTEIRYYCLDTPLDRYLLTRLAEREDAVLGTQFSQDIFSQLGMKPDSTGYMCNTGQTAGDAEAKVAEVTEVIEKIDPEELPETEEETAQSEGLVIDRGNDFPVFMIF